MHYAYPPRKSSNSPPYRPARAPKFKLQLPRLRRSHLRMIALACLTLVALFFFLTRNSRGSCGDWISGSHEYTSTAKGVPPPQKPSGKPPVVLVTVLESDKYADDYGQTIRENRIKYADKHGYGTFFPKPADYDLKGAPSSWAKVVAMRHAITKFPDAFYFWYLEKDAFVMNPDLEIEKYILKPSKLESLIIKDQPVVPPDSIIRTFGHLKGEDIDFVLSQDRNGLSVGSFIIRNSEWSRFFIETWFDPLYRSYNFQKAETHALEHIVQWHPTILSKLALIPQRTINAYNKQDDGDKYNPGDLAVRFAECANGGGKACEQESERFEQQWKTSFGIS